MVPITREIGLHLFFGVNVADGLSLYLGIVESFEIFGGLFMFMFRNGTGNE
jgi:hypothetical protein